MQLYLGHETPKRIPLSFMTEPRLTKFCARLAAASVHQLHLGQMCGCQNFRSAFGFVKWVARFVKDNRPAVLLDLALVQQGKELETRRSSFPGVHRPSPAR